MLETIRKILNRFNFMTKKTLLGRWCTNKNTTQINNTIDWANVDHCGTCAKK